MASSLLLGGMAWAQGIMPPSSPKLGYGFAPGLVAGKDFVASQLIVGYSNKGKAAGLATAAQALGGSVAKEIEGSAMLLNFGSERLVETAISQLTANPDVVFVERNGFMRIPPEPKLPDLAGQRAQNAQKMGLKGADMGVQSVSTDPGTGFQWHLTVIRKTAALPALVPNPPTVAVIDTGVDYTHPDLAGANKVLKGLNAVANNFDPFDDAGHGTHVAGLIAANAANGQYGEGVCPNCKILAVKVLGADGSGSFFDIAAGMAYARTWAPPAGVPAVRVLNMSLRGPDSALVRAQVDAIKAAGKVLVAAAGNENNNPKYWPSFPGADPDTALRVMATEEQDCRAWFSNFSTAAANLYNIAAPGWQTPSTVPDLGFAP